MAKNCTDVYCIAGIFHKCEMFANLSNGGRNVRVILYCAIERHGTTPPQTSHITEMAEYSVFASVRKLWQEAIYLL